MEKYTYFSILFSCREVWAQSVDAMARAKEKRLPPALLSLQAVRGAELRAVIVRGRVSDLILVRCSTLGIVARTEQEVCQSKWQKVDQSHMLCQSHSRSHSAGLPLHYQKMP